MTVGTSGSGGTGVDVAPALAFAHASGATVSEPNVSAPATGTSTPSRSSSPGRPGGSSSPTPAADDVSWTTSSDCGATLSAHTPVLRPRRRPRRTPSPRACARRSSPSGSMDGGRRDLPGLADAELPDHADDARRRRRTPATRTSRSASVTGMVVGNTLTVDPTGANPETVTITTVGTARRRRHGRHVHARARLRARSGRVRDRERRPEHLDRRAERHRAERDAGPTDASPTPGFGAPVADPDRGRRGREHEHGRPLHAGDRRRPEHVGRRRTSRSSTTTTRSRPASTSTSRPTQCSPRGRLRLLDERRRVLERAADARRRGPPSLAVLPRTIGTTGNGEPRHRQRTRAAVDPGRAARGQGDSASSRSAPPSTGSTSRCTCPDRRADDHEQRVRHRDGRRCSKEEQSEAPNLVEAGRGARLVLAAAAVAARRLGAAGGASPSPRSRRCSSDPFADGARLPRERGGAVDLRGDEPGTRAGPLQPNKSTIVATEQVGRVYDGGASDIGYEVSVNGGKTLEARRAAADDPGRQARHLRRAR